MYTNNGAYATESQDQCVEGTKMVIDDLTSVMSLSPSSHLSKLVSGLVLFLTS